MRQSVPQAPAAALAGSGGRQGDIYALFTEESGQPADLVNNSPVEPQVSWISAEEGSRSLGDLEDRAARYLIGSNRLLINADFRAFTDMVNWWTSKYEVSGSQAKVIKDTVREWFEQQLIETILSAWALRHTGRWSMQELPQLWSDEALTAAVLPRYHIDVNVPVYVISAWLSRIVRGLRGAPGRRRRYGNGVPAPAADTIVSACNICSRVMSMPRDLTSRIKQRWRAC